MTNIVIIETDLMSDFEAVDHWLAANRCFDMIYDFRKIRRDRISLSRYKVTNSQDEVDKLSLESMFHDQLPEDEVYSLWGKYYSSLVMAVPHITISSLYSGLTVIPGSKYTFFAFDKYDDRSNKVRYIVGDFKNEFDAIMFRLTV